MDSFRIWGTVTTKSQACTGKAHLCCQVWSLNVYVVCVRLPMRSGPIDLLVLMDLMIDFVNVSEKDSQF